MPGLDDPACQRFASHSQLNRVPIGGGAPRRSTGLSIRTNPRRTIMADSVYKIIELVGTSTESWEKAAKTAVERAAQTLRELRVAEIAQLDMTMEDGKVALYRAKVKVSFKYED
jgi:flavin-binding protein dodecin